MTKIPNVFEEDDGWYFALYNEDEKVGPYETETQARNEYLDACRLERA